MSELERLSRDRSIRKPMNNPPSQAPRKGRTMMRFLIVGLLVVIAGSTTVGVYLYASHLAAEKKQSAFRAQWVQLFASRDSEAMAMQAEFDLRAANARSPFDRKLVDIDRNRYIKLWQLDDAYFSEAAAAGVPAEIAKSELDKFEAKRKEEIIAEKR